MEELGYDKESRTLKVHWLLPGKIITDGLKLIETDSDTMVMMSVIDRVRNLVIYLDHHDDLFWYQLGWHCSKSCL